MAKRLFLLLFSAFIGIFGSPEILMASDDFTPVGLNNAGITETVPIIVEEPVVEEQEEVAVTTSGSAVQTSTAPAVATPAPVSTPAPAPAPQLANYTVSFYVNTRQEYVDTAFNLRYDGLYKFRKMIYGHNSWNLLGSLVSRYIGETFTITEGGVTRNYRVMDIRVYRKTNDGNLEGDPGLMTNIATTALGYDIALFTCHGTSYGNGDASHRYVVFANAI